MIASVSMAARLRREGRAGCSPRCTAHAISGRVTSCSESPERWSMSPRPRSWPASTPAALLTAAGFRSRVAAASAIVTSRPSAKQSASRAGARSSGSASAVPSGTAALPNTSSTSRSSTWRHRDRSVRVALLDRRLTALEDLEEGEKAGDRLEPGGHAGEHILEVDRAASETLPEQGDLVLDREGDRHRQRVGVAEALEHGSEGC